LPAHRAGGTPALQEETNSILLLNSVIVGLLYSCHNCWALAWTDGGSVSLTKHAHEVFLTDFRSHEQPAAQ
jgi:hypothetical protein